VLSLTGVFRKLRENQAFDVLRRPRVMANYALSRWEVPRRPRSMMSRPIDVEIELTNRCNLACIQCLRSRGLKPYRLGEMTFESYQKVLAQFPSLLNLSLNGFGEALMHPRLFEIVSYTKRQRPWLKVGIYSNGTLIDEDKAARLVDCGLTEVNVSVDAATAETYKRVRRGGRISDVHLGLRRLLRARELARTQLPKVGVNFVLLNENRGELVPFIEQAADIGVDFVNCISYASYDWGFRNQRSASDYQRELERARLRLDQLGLRCKSFPSADLSWTTAERGFSCDHFWRALRVTFEGELTLGCCTPFKEQYTYGNLLEVPFERIWNDVVFQRNRSLAAHGTPPTPNCGSCDRFGKDFFREEELRYGLPIVS
jgi:MoaA/NifB/PqqE/SkfB family radical SAM enzyme